MRRPLFAGCLCLVFIAVLRLLPGAAARNEEDVGGRNAFDVSELSERERLTLTGRVYQKDSEKFYLDSIVIQQKNPLQNIDLSDNLICEWEHSESLRLGSTVTLQGVFRSFSQATNPGEFDSRAYYQGLQIGGRLTEVKLLGVGEEYWALKELLYRMRSYWKERLYRVFPSKEAQLMGAMLLGDKEDLEGELRELYKKSGIIHILSISGLHITIIGMGIYRLLRRSGAPKTAAAVLGGGILVLYGVMTGMSISAYRAIGMYLLRMLAEVWGRTYDMLTALGVMAAVMTVQWPEYLQNAGFLLSFGSVMGIGVLYPALLTEKKMWGGIRYRGEGLRILLSMLGRLGRGLKESIQAGLAITLTTLPVQLWFYYEVPTYSLFINLLVLPFMSVVLITGLTAMLIPGLGILGTVDCLILKGFEELCGVFEGLPLHMWNPGRPKAWQIAVYYGLWLAVVWIAGKRGGGKRDTARDRGFAVQWIMLLIALMILTVRPSQNSRVTFLDVGQGDCIFIQTSSGEAYLFDCGSSSRKNVGKYVLLPFLKCNGIRELDGVFVSHGDNDHLNGIEELLQFAWEEDIRIKQLILPESGGADGGGQFDGLLQHVEQRMGQAVDICYMKAGDCIEDRGAYFRCLHPPAGYEGTGNEASECFYVELWNGRNKENKLSLLLTGDVEKKGELMLIEELKQYDISEVSFLKVSHHGSRNATQEAFVEQVNADISVISCGQNNSYGHPHREVLERLGRESHILQTCEAGAITVTLKAGQTLVEGYLW